MHRQQQNTSVDRSGIFGISSTWNKDDLEYEEKRQAEVLSNGGVIKQETRRWDDEKKETILMRVKEGSEDYRYFPDPDLVVTVIDDEWMDMSGTGLSTTVCQQTRQV